MAHTCLCWIKYGAVHMGPDLRHPGTAHCLSCGAEAQEVFKVQQEYEVAWERGEDVEFIQNLLDDEIKQRVQQGLYGPDGFPLGIGYVG